MIANRLVLILCLFTLLVVSSGASEFARSRAELDNLQGRIVSVRKQLQQDQSEADAVTGELDGIEQRLSSLHASIHQRQKQKDTLKRKILQLNQVAADLESRNNEAMESLAGLLKSSYILGRQSGLRLLINQQDPQVSVRQLTLFRYVMEARYEQLQDLVLLQQSVRENQQAISQQQHAMDETIAALVRDGDQLKHQEAARAKQLSRIVQQVKDSKQTMLLYQQREQWLKKLLLELARPNSPLQAVNKPAANTAKKEKKEVRQTQTVQRSSTSSASQAIGTMELVGFGNSRGTLPLPIKAGVRARFGQKKPESGLIWEGVLFNSRQGQPVIAVYPGQVVFSDWFRGYGQLMVLDHGGGYMSLYGYNRSLQVGLGDMVQSGQVIAMAGEAGELLAPGLYFEIRHNGLPDDPLQWCRL